MIENSFYATIKYIPQCNCPLNGLIRNEDHNEEHGIVCATCWKVYKAEIVYHDDFMEKLRNLI